MRRLFWIALGAAVGVYVMRKASRAAETFTPGGVADSIAGLGDAVRYFVEQVRAGMAEREIELRDALGLDGVAPATGPGSAPGNDLRRYDR